MSVDEWRGFIDPEKFLAKYWQKKPLIIRGLYGDATEWMDSGELAGMACEDQVESRLVQEQGAERAWQVSYGPFSVEQLSSLPKAGWSLLVQGVDRWVPKIGRRLEDFRFVPDWRIDDVMVSFAPQGAGIGPHLDHYDVFLIQGSGKRAWDISTKPLSPDSAILPDIDLKVLKHFVAEERVILEPGDLLYLPPLFGHHGVSLQDAMTFSVGFRAPRYADLCRAFAEHCASLLGEESFYEDPDLQLQENPANLSEAAEHRLQQPWLALLNDRQLYRRWLACYLTEPKQSSQIIDEAVAWNDLEELDAAALLFKREGRRVLWVPPADGLPGELAVEGAVWALHGDLQLRFAECLSQKTSWLWQELQEFCADPYLRAILLALVNRQQLLVALWQEWEESTPS